MRTWKLQTSLVLLLILTTMITFSLVGAVILAFRLPDIVKQAQHQANHSASMVTTLLENALEGMERQLNPVVDLAQTISDHDIHELMDSILRDEGFHAMYIARADGQVDASAHIHVGFTHDHAILVGADLSENRLFKAVLKHNSIIWSDQYLSAYTGDQAIAVGFPVGKRVLIAELPKNRLREIATSALQGVANFTLVVDRRGEWIVDNQSGVEFEYTNWGSHPVFLAAKESRAPPEQASFDGINIYPAFQQSRKLNWIAISGLPAGMQNLAFAQPVLLVIFGFTGSLIIGAILAPFWARWLLKPVKALMQVSRDISSGNYQSQWKAGAIEELNVLGADLSLMAKAISEREKSIVDKESLLQQTFNSAPGPMLITRFYDNDHRVQDANNEFVALFQTDRDWLIGKSGKDTGWWVSIEDRNRFIETFESEGKIRDFNVWMKTQNGVPILLSISVTKIDILDKQMSIFTYRDITAYQQIQKDIIALNNELEQRVLDRTLALEQTNNELEAVVASLELTQVELVQSEKLAALGGMVAGISHELNTPIGNSKISINTLAEMLVEFRQEMALGLKRSTLDRFVDDVSEATEITVRNLNQATTLVSAFKQVAADRTSSQRRKFKAQEIVNEALLVLRPTLKRTAYKIQVDISQDLAMDSYPGPLGQVLTNLLNNTIDHAFSEIKTGNITIAVVEIDEKNILFIVTDNGKGMSGSILKRAFDPFFTTRLGSGGTGLGLHVAHNIVANILGGTIDISSELGSGTKVIISLPKVAPQVT